MGRFQKDITKSQVQPVKRVNQQIDTGQSVRSRSGDRAEPVEIIITSPSAGATNLGIPASPFLYPLPLFGSDFGQTVIYDPYKFRAETSYDLRLPKSGVYKATFIFSAQLNYIAAGHYMQNFILALLKSPYGATDWLPGTLQVFDISQIPAGAPFNSLTYSSSFYGNAGELIQLTASQNSITDYVDDLRFSFFDLQLVR